MTTTIDQHEIRSQFTLDLKRVSEASGPPWLQELRAAGASRFQETAFPHYKDEAWRFTGIAPILRTPFRAVVGAASPTVSTEAIESHLYEDDAWDQIVFIDGFWSEEHSRISAANEDVLVASLASLIEKGDGDLEAYLDKTGTGSSAFTALNSALFQDAAVVRIGKNITREAPIHILHISTGEAKSATNPRTLVVTNESSEAVIVETYIGLGGKNAHLTNCITEVVVGDNSRVQHIKVVAESECGYHLCNTHVRQGRASNYESYVVTLSGQIVRNELRVLLDGEGAECALNGLYLTDGDRLIDNHLFVEHAQPRCQSRMGYKGILDDSSQAVFTGKVLVPSNAHHTDSDQLNNNLLLSDKATIDTMPQLEIFAEEVKCTHGATIGSFPEELIFYFQSRGMDPEMARGILTYGFADEIIQQLPVGAVRERLHAIVFANYSPE